MALVLLLALAFAGTFLLTQESGSQFEGIWYAQMARGEPAACYAGNEKATTPMFGPNMSILLFLVDSLFGRTQDSLRLAYAAIFAIAAFLTYVLAKRIYSRPAALAVLAVFVLQGLAFWPDKGLLLHDTWMQNAVSVAFVIALLAFLDGPGGPLAAASLGFLAGFGVTAKIYFVPFLLSAAAALVVTGRKGVLRKAANLNAAAAFILALAIAAVPFFAYNLRTGFLVFGETTQALSSGYTAQYGYSPLDFGTNILARASHLAVEAGRNGWTAWILPAAALASAAHLAFFWKSDRQPGGKPAAAYVFWLALFFLAATTLSYHPLDPLEMEAGRSIFFLVLVHPLASGISGGGTSHFPWRALLGAAAILALGAAAMAGRNAPSLGGWRAESPLPRGPIYYSTCQSAISISYLRGDSGLDLRRVGSLAEYERIVSQERGGAFLLLFENPRTAAPNLWGWEDEATVPKGEILSRVQGMAARSGCEMRRINLGWEDYYYHVFLLWPA